MTETNKVILLGLDGATWGIIEPLVKKGELPGFKRLIENGAWGVLKSTIPPLSPSAWVSIYTGCKPHQHGIFGFVKRKENSYFYRPISSKDIKKPTLWEILSEYDIRSIVINALFMYPPKKINGVIITGLGTPSLDSNFVYPPEYREMVLKKFPKYDVDFDEDLLLVSNDAENFLNKIEEVTIEQMKLTWHLFENEEWTFLFSIFRALDVVQHYFWNDLEILSKFYKLLDEFLLKIIDAIEHDKKGKYTLFLVSDHGFAQVKKYFCVNNWLEQEDMLKMITPKGRGPITAETIKKVLLKLGFRNMVWRLKRSTFVEKLLKFIPSEELGYMNSIQWNKTLAYYYEGSDGIININLRGREPEGTVDPEDYEKIVASIVKKLKEVRDPETGETIVEAVHTKNDLFGTDDLSVPDIYILLKNGYRAVAYNKINEKSIFMPPVHGRIHRPGDHHVDGIFGAYGEGIIPKRLQKPVYLWDIAPTVLTMLGVPIPSYMDGQSIEVITDETYFSRGKIDMQKKLYEKKKIQSVIRSLREKGGL